MLQALKRIYSFTSCIIGEASNASEEFQTFSGIRQGAPSSVLLFIFFMDELVSHLQYHCVEEPLLKLLHCLLHADDTAILSTDRELFIKKCNAMLKYFNDHSLGLNFPKSSYLIINGGDVDIKCDIQLDFGTLVYKPRSIYLGVVVSDTGIITNDIDDYINEKRSNITIKYNNFLHKNYLAPLDVKLMVLDACVSSTLVYACETWGLSKVNQVEVAYRLGLKRALSIRESTITELVYLEAGKYPLYIRITKQQLNFWLKLNSYLLINPNHPLADLIDYGRRIHLNFISYYDNLVRDFESTKNCQKQLEMLFDHESQEKIRREAGIDNDSRLGVYNLINPQLVSPKKRLDVLESERIIITRYRIGSHNLSIEKGRLNNPPIPREERLCACQQDIQSLRHILFNCPLLTDLYLSFNFTSVNEAMNRIDLFDFLIKMERNLGISG